MLRSKYKKVSLSFLLLFANQNCVQKSLPAMITADSKLHLFSSADPVAAAPVPGTDRVGVAHMVPPPNGGGGNDGLSYGARDAYSMGFRTLKILLGQEALDQDIHYSYYHFDAESTASIHSLIDLAKYGPYKQVFDLPFQTYFMTTTEFGLLPLVGDFFNVPISEDAKSEIYRQIYDITAFLMKTYAFTGKMFVLQNHEGDWHTYPDLPNQWQDAFAGRINPPPMALDNFRTYWKIRQSAVNDAKRDNPFPGVSVYHMCEVVTVTRSWKLGKPSLASEVLPDVNCDLVGYSAYESTLTRDTTLLPKSIEYLKRQSRGSPTFGANNVVLSEFGWNENDQSTNADIILGLMEKSILSLNVPWILMWDFYTDGWAAKKADGSEGILYKKYSPYFGQIPKWEVKPIPPKVGLMKICIIDNTSGVAGITISVTGSVSGSATTDENGCVSGRVPYGTYRGTAVCKGQTVSGDLKFDRDGKVFTYNQDTGSLTNN